MFNQITIQGNVGLEPQVRYTQDNKPIANLSVATTEKWKDSSGQEQKETQWHRVVVFGKLAEVVQKYVKKGDKILFSGKMKYRQWTDSDDVVRHTSEIHIDSYGRMVMLGGSDQHKEVEQKEVKSPTAQVDSEAHAFDDEIPF